MKLVKPSVEFMDSSGSIESIEVAARVCYKSEGKITMTSAKPMFEMLLRNGHNAMIEFGWMFYKVICDRGVTHEIVRHRLFSYAQESTRYCNYSGGIEFIIPCWSVLQSAEFSSWPEVGELATNTELWLSHMSQSERTYIQMIRGGWTPQQARSVLPNSLKTEICIAGNFREWRHFFKLRTAKSAHPQMQEVANMILVDAKKCVKTVFDDC